MSAIQEIFKPNMPAEDDYFAGLVLGVLSIFSTCWWFALMFIYVKNHSGDVDLMDAKGLQVLPIGWFWERLVGSGN